MLSRILAPKGKWIYRETTQPCRTLAVLVELSHARDARPSMLQILEACPDIWVQLLQATGCNAGLQSVTSSPATSPKALLREVLSSFSLHAF